MPNTSPMYRASPTDRLPCANSSSQIGAPRMPRNTAAGTTITDASRTPLEKPARTRGAEGVGDPLVGGGWPQGSVTRLGCL